jgi:hypothetical protein
LDSQFELLHNVFSREHNQFVDEFHRTLKNPDADCGLRNPDDPHHVIRYRDIRGGFFKWRGWW